MDKLRWNSTGQTHYEGVCLNSQIAVWTSSLLSVCSQIQFGRAVFVELKVSAELQSFRTSQFPSVGLNREPNLTEHRLN